MMQPTTRPRRLVGRPTRWTAALLISLAWMAVIAFAVPKLKQPDAIFVAFAGVGAALATFGVSIWYDRARWRVPLEELTEVARSMRQDRNAGQALTLPPTPELADLTREIAGLGRSQRPRAVTQAPTRTAREKPPPDRPPPRSTASMTRSGLFDGPPESDGALNPNMSGDFSTIDMVNRLDPVGFRWIESSPAEQDFLGWTLAELRQKSFLDIVHPDDRPRAAHTLHEALERGESLGLIVRVRTANAKTRAVEVNVGARYGTTPAVSHLRCHLTDVSDKVRAERELKLRTQELTRVNEQLRKINRELEELKDRYTDQNRRLGEANVELSQRNRELDEFVYVVSHDLQEPLRTLVSFSGFLMKDYGDRLESDGKEYLRYLVEASRRMRAMIHGLLKLSRAGKVIGELAMVDLAELLAVTKADLGELLRTKNAQLRITNPLPEVWGDHARIGQLLANLIVNGIKYNQSSSPWVEVEANRDTGADSPGHAHESHLDSHIVIAVKDNGIGIEPEYHKTIFQLFRRLHTHDEYEGTGVGLAICNKIVNALGGRIWVRSTPGEGSTFFIRLRSGPPMAALPPSSAAGVLPHTTENSASQVSPDESPTI
jgi:PAS domain S-box-containing protein